MGEREVRDYVKQPLSIAECKEIIEKRRATGDLQPDKVVEN